jgi:flagellar hook protein FlgE
MSLNTFTTALSGLDANTQGLSVVGNNIANLNTVGFKGSTISFAEMLDEEVGVGGGNSVNLGLGTVVQSVRANFQNGGIATTNNPLDVAIQGKGFLVLSNDGQKYYSRSGNLHLDANNTLVGDNGMPVQGYIRNPSTQAVDPNLGLQNIQMPSGLESPVQTSQFALSMNLDGSAPNATQFTASVQVYDSTGVPHVAQLTLQKQITTGASPTTQWNFDLTIPTKDTAGGSGTGNISLITGTTATATPSAGTLVFDNSGKLTSAYLGSSAPSTPTVANLQIPPTGVTLPTMANGSVLSPKMTWKLLNADGTPSITGFSGASNVSASSQNGSASGSLSSLNINADGTIGATFSNGQTVSFAQLVLAQFGNVDGLTPRAGGLFQESPSSGSSVIDAPGSGGSGTLVGGALEQSNVDLATELTKILTFQRGYQANAKLITATDQIMQDTLQMVQ